MTDRDLALIHAEIDGELDGHQRGELAAVCLLADPGTRAGVRFDHSSAGSAEASRYAWSKPSRRRDLQTRFLTALPQIRRRATPYTLPEGRCPDGAMPRLFAGVLGAGALVFETVRGPGPATSEVTGTMAAGAPVTLDRVTLGDGPVAGRVSLYRDGAGLAVALELTADSPVDVLVTGQGSSTLRINGLD